MSAAASCMTGPLAAECQTLRGGGGGGFVVQIDAEIPPPKFVRKPAISCSVGRRRTLFHCRGVPVPAYYWSGSGFTRARAPKNVSCASKRMISCTRCVRPARARGKSDDHRRLTAAAPQRRDRAEGGAPVALPPTPPCARARTRTAHGGAPVPPAPPRGHGAVGGAAGLSGRRGTCLPVELPRRRA